MAAHTLTQPHPRADGPDADVQAAHWIELHLGTRVGITGYAAQQTTARAAVTAAFEEVALIHRLMSFHQEDSDVSRLNRDGARRPVQVDRRTVQVLRAACEVSRASQGLFDITVAPELVRAGCLPRPPAACEPRNEASWQDIEIVSDDTVFLHKPLWLDLGGIAKGFAVDRAFQLCAAAGDGRCIVDAGGDIRISEGLTGLVTLDAPDSGNARIPRVELSAGAIASSCGSAGEAPGNRGIGPHFDGVTRSAVDPRRFVSVLAESCMVADALTKVVLVLGEGALPLLSRYGANALLYDGDGGWRQLSAESEGS